MKQRLNILLITLLLLVAGTFSVSAQIVDEKGQYVDTIFNDNIDRSAEDFVKISLLISEPAKGLFSPFGHTAFRLQCPIFDLDYVFHYAMFQSGKSDNSNQTLAYITGQFEVRLIADTFATYLRDNEAKHRGLKEYPLNLSPTEEQKLWRILDEEMVREKILKFDFFRKGCAVKMLEMVEKTVGINSLDYSDANPYFNRPQYEIVARQLEDVPWVRFAMTTAMFGCTHLRFQEKLQVPSHLAAVWQATQVNGRRLAGDEIILSKHWYYTDDSYLTPDRIALLFMLISMLSLFLRKNYLDYVVLAMQAFMAVSVLSIAIVGFSYVRWNWLFVPFNILPIICWKWRRYWALPYAGILMLWVIVMLFIPHCLVDTTHIILVQAFIVVLLHQSNALQRYLIKYVVQDKYCADKPTKNVTNKNK